MNSGRTTPISHEFPPNIATIVKTFPINENTIFAYDGVIYNPGKRPLSAALIAHEEVHFEQQQGDPDGWWQCYIKDVEFRLREELEAHRVEYRVYCLEEKDRNKRALYLRVISARLASPMYGSIVSKKEAKKLIKGS